MPQQEQRSDNYLVPACTLFVFLIYKVHCQSEEVVLCFSDCVFLCVNFQYQGSIENSKKYYLIVFPRLWGESFSDSRAVLKEADLARPRLRFPASTSTLMNGCTLLSCRLDCCRIVDFKN